jgi:hypothetical protein
MQQQQRLLVQQGQPLMLVAQAPLFPLVQRVLPLTLEALVQQ